MKSYDCLNLGIAYGYIIKVIPMLFVLSPSQRGSGVPSAGALQQAGEWRAVPHPGPHGPQQKRNHRSTAQTHQTKPTCRQRGELTFYFLEVASKK